ncbi:Na+/H+ antiporter NhaA [Marixanthomonas sp. SCSIO 43207]|uniref:Na+/H+ antiporter NhaA n=1 Tax=Marixanthomonas sp. SCSIO 43207 TaxID=2779360 RepID=UPI001CA84ADB|nr:Na+/H+ antiporter NhaA [Marixanthomonas sp. SCSIO 43207]UAB81077.1 Na+/H+ antiporter NhaA [Marixanthomonas sp. SCSIO 43207]
MIREKIITPFKKFIQIEALSGILLLAATIVALIWANSPYGDLYQSIWQYKIGISIQDFELNKPLILWINDGLMAVFFFLIGLEIKREFLIGELNSVKKVAFPLFGAIGGMTVPVLIFVLLNQNPATLEGWAIPMATDIAFALAVLKLLGNRVPLSLKVFLTAFAIVDDIGAVMVIAVFYSGSLKLGLLGIALGLLAVLYFISFRGYYSKFLLFIFGVVIWTLFLKAGIHPTIAGILLAFSIPVRQKIYTTDFIDILVDITSNIKKAEVIDKPILSNEQIQTIDDLEDWTGKFQSPLQHLEHSLHGWVAYLIIPVFAFANAGVALNSDVPLDTTLMTIIAASLVLGNSIGVTTIVLFAQKIKLITIPSDITTKHIIGVSFLAGIGFTMSIFVASLAFNNSPSYIDSAKTGILLGSLVSAVIGFTILRIGSVKKYKRMK